MAVEISSIGSGPQILDQQSILVQGIRTNTASESKPHVSSRIAFPRC